MTMNPSPSPPTPPLGLRSRVERAAQTLRTTADDANALEEAALRLTSAGNDGAALGQQLSAAIESIAASAEQAAVTTAKIAKSQQSSAEFAADLLSGMEDSATAL